VDELTERYSLPPRRCIKAMGHRRRRATSTPIHEPFGLEFGTPPLPIDVASISTARTKQETGSIPVGLMLSGKALWSEDNVMDKDDVVATLNDLIETSRDGEDGFQTCADGVKSAQLKQMFQQAASRCAQVVSELQAKVRAVGGDPERRGSVSGSLTVPGSTSSRPLRGWMKPPFWPNASAAKMSQERRMRMLSARTYLPTCGQW